jgi:hypothetical protein
VLDVFEDSGAEPDFVEGGVVLAEGLLECRSVIGNLPDVQSGILTISSSAPLE